MMSRYQVYNFTSKKFYSLSKIQVFKMVTCLSHKNGMRGYWKWGRKVTNPRYAKQALRENSNCLNQ